MDAPESSYGGSPNTPVDTYIEHGLGLLPSAGRNRRLYAADQDNLDQHLGAPVYAARKVRASKAAIENLHKLQKARPLKPPGRP